MNDMFTLEPPAHIKYGYSSMEIGQVLKIQVCGKSEVAKIRGGLGAYGQYYGRKFRTKTKGGNLYIKRIK